MKYPTKKKRLLAIVDAFSLKTGRKVYTMDEVAEWALLYDLYPCPKHGDPVCKCEDWEKLLATVMESDSPATQPGK